MENKIIVKDDAVKKNLISICVPCYEMHGNGANFLTKLLDSILTQTYKRIEVVVSDHSQDDLVMDVCNEYKKKMDIVYLRNTIDRGSSSSNINNAIKHSKGTIIKPLFQDDFFISADALENINSSPCGWGASACVHTDEDAVDYHTFHYARWDDNMKYGKNMIGCPSVIFFKKDVDTLFDPTLKWLMDCEMYHRLYEKYGLPGLLQKPQVCVRLWGNTVTNTLTDEEKKKEEDLLRERYA